MLFEKKRGKHLFHTHSVWGRKGGEETPIFSQKEKSAGSLFVFVERREKGSCFAFTTDAGKEKRKSRSRKIVMVEQKKKGRKRPALKPSTFKEKRGSKESP